MQFGRKYNPEKRFQGIFKSGYPIYLITGKPSKILHFLTIFLGNRQKIIPFEEYCSSYALQLERR